jgi:hypothetical protein
MSVRRSVCADHPADAPAVHELRRHLHFADGICARPTTACATGPRRAGAEAVDTSTRHIGFRCVIRPA